MFIPIESWPSMQIVAKISPTGPTNCDTEGVEDWLNMSASFARYHGQDGN